LKQPDPLTKHPSNTRISSSLNGGEKESKGLHHLRILAAGAELARQSHTSDGKLLCSLEWAPYNFCMEQVQPPVTPNSLTPLEVLRWCAAAEPQLWFPGEHCQAHQIDRASIDEPLWLLRQAELVQVADWIKGRGQGFVVTDSGREALQQPNPAKAIDDARAMPQKPLVDEDPDRIEEEEDRYEPTVYDRGETTRQAFFGPQSPYVTWLFLWANVFWFLFCWTQASKDNLSTTDFLKSPTGPFLIRHGAAFGPSLLMGEWWRLISSAFVHIGLLHLLLNTLALYSIGPTVETLFGRWRVAVLYLLCALGSSCLAVGLHPTGALAGASGAIWGLLVAVFVWLLRFRDHLPPDLAAENLQKLLVVLVFNALLSFAPNISWEGHLGGGISGAIVSLLLANFQTGKRLRRRVLSVIGLVLFAVAAVGVLLLFMRFYPKWEMFRFRPPAPTTQTIPNEVVKQLILDVELPKVVEAHKASSAALITRSPKTLESSLNQVTNIANSASMLISYLPATNEPTAVAFRTYLIEVRTVSAILQEHLKAGRAPPSEESKRLGQHLQAMRQAWDKLEKAQKPK
jgi:rhomboid protease GluP